MNSFVDANSRFRVTQKVTVRVAQRVRARVALGVRVRATQRVRVRVALGVRVLHICQHMNIKCSFVINTRRIDSLVTFRYDLRKLNETRYCAKISITDYL